MTAAHVVPPDDEARHTPDAEELWNESYYCDFVNADGSLGGWLRLGLYPNRKVAYCNSACALFSFPSLIISLILLFREETMANSPAENIPFRTMRTAMITIARNRLPIDIFAALPRGFLRKNHTSRYYFTIFLEEMLGPRRAPQNYIPPRRTTSSGNEGITRLKTFFSKGVDPDFGLFWTVMS